MALVWREELSVGNDAIDSDHKHLIDLINQIEICMKSKNLIGLKEACEELDKYSLLHFRREEKIAKSAGYPQVPELNHAHVIIKKELDDMRGEFESASKDLLPELVKRFISFLRHWLIDHVLQEDMKMKPILKKLSPSFVPI